MLAACRDILEWKSQATDIVSQLSGNKDPLSNSIEASRSSVDVGTISCLTS